MKNIFKRSLATLLVLVMLITSMPMEAFAEFKLSAFLSALLPEEETSETAEDVSEDVSDVYEEPVTGDEEEEVPDDTEENNVTWSFDETTGELRISGKGEMENYGFEDVNDIQEIPWFSHYKEITSIVVEEGITSIGDAAFAMLYNAETISLPSTLRTIGDYALIYLFGLDELVIPEGVTTLGESAVAMCNLSRLVIPSTIEEFDDSSIHFEVTQIKEIINHNSSLSVVEDGFYGFFDDYENAKQYLAYYEGSIICMLETEFGNATDNEEFIFRFVNERLEKKGYAKFETLEQMMEWMSEIENNARSSFPEWFEIVCLEDSAEHENARIRGAKHKITGTDEYCNCFVLSGQNNSVTWNIDPETRTLTFGGTGTISDSEDGWENLNRLYDTVKFESGSNITAITISALGKINKIEIPATVSEIDFGYRKTPEITIDSANEYYCSKNNYVLSKDETVLYRYSGSQEKVEIPSTVTDVQNYAFIYCQSLKEIIIPENVQIIEYSAFENCYNLEKVEFAENSQLDSIGSYVFEYCGKLEEITIPASVTYISYDAFNRCSVLKNINVESGNSYYSSENGILYNADKTEIIKYPEGKTETEITIPVSVTNIGNYAFYYCSNLEKVEFEENSQLTTINSYTFSYCSSLKEITIPASVTSVSYGVFNSCNQLEKLTVLNSQCVFDSDVFGYNGISENLTIYGYAYSSVHQLAISKNINFESIGDIAPSDPSDFTYSELSDGTIEITGYNGSSANVVIPEKINDKIVTSIGKQSFRYNDNILRVVMPSGVKIIDEYAFYDCDKIGIVEFAENSNLETIGYEAFGDCNALERITIPASVKTISDEAFYYSQNLRKVEFESDSHLETIGQFAFRGCYDLEEIIIPSGVTSIGRYAFSGCNNLKNVVLPDNSSFTEIADNTFNNCQFAHITIPESITSIGNYAFYSNNYLTEITISGNVSYIGESAFGSCTALSSIEVSADNTSYCSVDGVLYNADKTILMQYPAAKSGKTFTIPASVTSNGAYAFSGATNLENITFAENCSIETIVEYTFYNCYSLKEITIPASVTSIGDYAFYSCDNLEKIEFAENSQLTTIGRYVFGYCSSLKEITIPASVTSIGYEAFSHCEKLEKVEFEENSQLTELKSEIFYDCPLLKEITIPAKVTNLSQFYFNNFSSLEYINVQNGNTQYSSKNGILYNADKTTLILYPKAKKNTVFVIPESVETISNNAFYNCKNLKRILCKEYNYNLEYIETNAFYGCSGLKEVRLPGSLEYIYQNAFNGCNSLEKFMIYSYYCDFETDVFGGSVPANFMIYGYDESTAQTYAENNNIAFSMIDEYAGNGNTNWSFNASTGELRISGTGDMPDYSDVGSSDSVAPWMNHYADITSIVVENGITSIGAFAFAGLYNVEKISLPSTLEIINDYAFAYMMSLKELIIPEGVVMLGDSCIVLGGIETLELPASLEITENRVFEMCLLLKTLINKNRDTVFGIQQSFYSGDYETQKKSASILFPVYIVELEKMLGNDRFDTPEKQLEFINRHMIENGFEPFSEIAEVKLWIKQFLYSSSVDSIPDWFEIRCYDDSAEHDYVSKRNITHSLLENPDELCTCFSFNGEYESFTWRIDSETKTLIIGGNGELPAYAYEDEYNYSVIEYPWRFVNRYYENVVFESDCEITSIDLYSFGKIKKITIPASVKAIEREYDNAPEILVDDANTVYKSVDSVLFSKDMKTLIFYPNVKTSLEYVIPEGVETISEYAFHDCSSLKEITIPASVTSIGYNAFYYCRNLEKVEFEENSQLVTIGSSTFYYSKIKEIIIPASVTNIGSYAFSSCDNLEKLTVLNPLCDFSSLFSSVPENLTICGYTNSTIHQFAEDNNISFESIGEVSPAQPSDFTYSELSDGTISVTGYTGTATIVPIPEKIDDKIVTTIGTNAFQNKVIIKATVPATVTSIGEYAFANCNHLSELIFAENSQLLTIYGYAFYYSKIKEIVIPASVTSIGYGAFYHCNNLEKVEFEENSQLTTIGSYVFEYCSSLKEITIPASVTSIGSYAFISCSALQNITILNPSCVINSSMLSSGYPAELTISGHENSTAKTFAENKNISFLSVCEDFKVEKNEGVCGDKYYIVTRCSVCNYEFNRVATDEILEHTMSDWTTGTAATCTQNGSEIRNCTNCGYSETSTIDALGHDFSSEWTIDKEATCTENGSKSYHCSRCTEKDSVTVIEAFGHSWSEWQTIDATCTKDGCKYQYCLNCGIKPVGRILLPAETYPESSHNYSNNMNKTYNFSYAGAEKLYLTFSTSTEFEINYDYLYIYNSAGTQIGKYSGKTLAGKTIEIEGDSFSLRLTTDGSVLRYGFSFSKIEAEIFDTQSEHFELIPATGHDYAVTTIDPTCTDNGSETSICNNCSDTVIVETDALGHDFAAEWTIDSEPTCTQTGSKSKHCSRCDVRSEVTVIDALGHNYESTRVPATESMEEHTYYKCSRCDSDYILLDPATPVNSLILIENTYSISLSWLKSVEATVTGYNVYRKSADEEAFSVITTLNSRNTVSYTDRDVITGVEYQYYVTALKGDVEGIACESVSGVPQPDTEAPRVLKADPSRVIEDRISGNVSFSLKSEDNIGVVKHAFFYSAGDSEEWILVEEKSGASATVVFNTKNITDGTYRFRTVAYDEAGNFSNDFINEYIVDNTGPEKVTGLNAKAIYAASATIAWSEVSDSDFHHFILKKKTEDGYSVISESVSTLGYNLTGLTPETRYTYIVAGVDKCGNIGEFSDEFTFETTSDTNAPVITKVSPAPARYNKKIDFNVTAEDDFNIQKIVIISSADLNEWSVVTEKEFSGISSQRKQTFTVLLDSFAEGNLFLAAVAYDNAENSSPYGNDAAYVQYIVDRTPPVAPAGVKATGGDRQINVSWAQGAESDIGQYSIYRSTAESGEYTLLKSGIKALNYYDTAVTDGVTYYYKVLVNDNCGNVSDFSEVVFANLNQDTQKPVVTSIGLLGGSVAGPSRKTIGLLVQDNKAIKNVVVEYKHGDNENYTVLLNKTYTDNQYYKSIDIDLPYNSLVDGEKVYVRAYCTDISGLVSEYKEAAVITVDRVAPEVTDIDYSVNGSKYTLTWKDSGETDINGFRVYSSLDGGAYKHMASRAYNASGIYSITADISAGAYNVKIEAVDKAGNTKEFACPSFTIEGSSNYKLEAVIDSPSFFEVGVEETFSAEKSVSSEGIVSYHWDFGNGTTASSEKLNKSFNNAGTYEITLTVEDVNGNTSTASKKIEVKEREMLGKVKVYVVDDSSIPVKNAEVYFGSVEDEHVGYTNSQGVVETVMPVGIHNIAAIADTSKYLPDEENVTVLANETTEVTLTLVNKPMIELELVTREITDPDEIIALGIDTSDPANRHIIQGEITATYTTVDGGAGATKIIFVSNNNNEIIDWYPEPDPEPDPTPDPTPHPFDPKPLIIKPVMIDKDIVAVLTIPVEASFLKPFYNVTLYVQNNAEQQFSISDCDVELNVPEGLTVMSSSPIASTIYGGTTESASWFVRGDKEGKYTVSADFNGIIDRFNKPISGSAADTIDVRGLDGITLRAVFNTMIKNNTLYFNLMLENDSGYDIFYPEVNYQKTIDNLIIYAPKKDKDTEITSECLGVSLVSSDGIAETYDVDTEFKVLHDGEKLKYEFKISGIANDEVTGFYSDAFVDCAPEFKDHIVVEEGYIYSYDGEEQIVKYTERYADAFDNKNGLVMCFYNKSKVAEYEVDYFVGSKSGDVHAQIDNVTVHYGDNKKFTVDKECGIKFSDIRGYDITIEAPGFRTKLIPADVVEKWATSFSISQKIVVQNIYLEQDHKDGKPYIISAYGKENINSAKQSYTDLMLSTLTVTGAGTCDVIIKADAGSSGTIESYWLSQDDEHKISSNDGNFTGVNLYEIFSKDSSKGIYGYVIVNDNGEKIVSDPIKLGIEIQDLSPYTEYITNMNNTTINLIDKAGTTAVISDDIPLIGGSTISMNPLTCPVGVSVTGNKVLISFGVSIFSEELNPAVKDIDKNKYFKDFKLAVKDWEKGRNDAINKFKDTVYGTVLEEKETFNIDFYGYIEGELVNGNIVPVEYSGSLKGNFNYKYRQYGAVYVIPVDAYVEASTSFIVKMVRAKQLPDSNVPFDFGFEISITPSLKVGGGAGIEGVLRAGVFAKGVLEYTNDFAHKYHKLKMTGTFGVEAEVFFLKKEKEIVGTTWTPIDGYYGNAKEKRMMLRNSLYLSSSGDGSSDSEETELIDRDYLTEMSDWNEKPIESENIGATSGTLMESVYSQSENQIVRFGDKLMQVYVEDDATRDTYNFARLMYSVYDNNSQTWSTPEAVYDDGHIDSAPSICVDADGKVHIAWQKLDTTFSEENGTIDEILKNGEIFCAEYDESKNAFINVTKLSDDSLYDSMPVICAENDSIAVYWVKNTQNNMSIASSNTIMKYVPGNDAYVVADGLNYISDITATNGEVTVIYDTNGDLSNSESPSLISYNNSGEVVRNKQIDNLVSVTYSESELYFATMDVVGTIDENGEIVYIFNADMPLYFTVENNEAFWIENDKLMYAKCENDVWSVPVVIAENEGSMANMTAAQINDYDYIIYSTTEVTTADDGTQTAGKTDLRFMKINQYADMSVYLDAVDEFAILSGTEDNVSLYVENNGNTSVEKINIHLSDTLGNTTVVSEEVNLAPGTGKTVYITYAPGENYTTTDLTVTVSAQSSFEERTPEDNTVTEKIGLCDLFIENTGIESIGDNYFLSAIISNSSMVSAENVVVKTYFGSRDTEPVDTKYFNYLNTGESLNVSIPMCKNNLVYDEDGYAKVWVVVSAAADESMTENNATYFLIVEEDSVCGHPVKTLVSSVPATCTEDGSAVYTCEICLQEVTETIPATGHDYGEWEIITSSTCKEAGLECRICKNDSTHVEYRDITDLAEHKDDDNDEYCDVCKKNLTELSTNCSHVCHSNNNIVKFLWRIIVFMCKLFNVQTHYYCECGAEHW